MPDSATGQVGLRDVNRPQRACGRQHNTDGYRHAGGSESGEFDDLIAADRMRRFDLTAPPLIRFTLIQVAGAGATGQEAASAKVQTLQSQGHFLFVGYRLE